jgi:hypothetical protein
VAGPFAIDLAAALGQDGWMRTLPFVLPAVVALAAASTAARAATVERVHKDKDKIIVSLSQVELASLEDGQDVVVEIAKPRIVLSGQVTKVNPLKKTAVIRLEAAEPRLARRQALRFLSVYWNVAQSPVITSFAQYHQYGRSFGEGGFGGFAEGTREKAGDRKSQTSAFGTRLAADGYVLLNPQSFGAGFDYERRDATFVSRPAGGKTEVGVTYNQVTPGAWANVQDHWRLGAGYRYTVIDQHFHGSGGSNFSFDFGQPTISVVRYDSETEYGFDYVDKDKMTAEDFLPGINGAGEVTESTMKLPAEAFGYIRSVSSPLFIWGVGAGWIFYERELSKSEPLREKATPAQQLRLRASLESRLEGGDKLDWVVAYDGGKALGLSTFEQTANELGVTATYQTTLGEALVVGGNANVAGGYVSLRDEQIDDQTGEAEEVARKVYGYRVSVMAFARYEVDLLGRKGWR